MSAGAFRVSSPKKQCETLNDFQSEQKSYETISNYSISNKYKCKVKPFSSGIADHELKAKDTHETAVKSP